MQSTDTKLLNEQQAANFLNLSVGTLRNWRTTGTNRGPLFHKLAGHAIRYSSEDLRDFVNDSKVMVAS